MVSLFCCCSFDTLFDILVFFFRLLLLPPLSNTETTVNMNRHHQVTYLHSSNRLQTIEIVWFDDNQKCALANHKQMYSCIHHVNSIWIDARHNHFAAHYFKYITLVYRLNIRHLFLDRMKRTQYNIHS